MEGIVFINDKFVPAKEAKVSAFDRGFLFGDGVYEVVPVVNSTIVDKAPFLQRLEHSLRAVGIRWPYSKARYVAILEDLIRRNDLKEGGVYTQVTRGVGPRDFAYPKDTPPTCMAFTMAKDFVNTPLAKSGVAVVTVEDIRWKRRDIKSISLLGQCMAKQEAYENGAYEGWMVEDGVVTEGTTSSAYIIKNKKIITRPLSRSILPGIRRKCLLQLAATNNIAIEERLFTVAEALDADEALLSSATTLVLPVVEIDGHVIGNGKPGKMTKRLRSLYVQRVQKESGSVPAAQA